MWIQCVCVVSGCEWTGTNHFPAVYLLLLLQHRWLYYEPSYKFSQAVKHQCERDPSLLLYRGDLCACFWTYAQCLVWNIKPSHSLSLCVCLSDWNHWILSSWNGYMKKWTSFHSSPKQTHWLQRSANSSRSRWGWSCADAKLSACRFKGFSHP